MLLPSCLSPSALSAWKLKVSLPLSPAVVQDTFQKWFMVHIGTQVAGLLLMLAAAIIALTRNRPFDHHLNHFQLGVAVIALVLLQPCSAIPRLMMHHVGPTCVHGCLALSAWQAAMPKGSALRSCILGFEPCLSNSAFRAPA